jgi:hypothetical protein
MRRYPMRPVQCRTVYLDDALQPFCSQRGGVIKYCLSVRPAAHLQAIVRGQSFLARLLTV